mmetsp:Transcript_36938/g.92598  ORF Transcript_36938/g.92598 Transcript_36938/m.92598 type:complete len:230 (+) Transcript_36938:74-763(+)
MRQILHLMRKRGWGGLRWTRVGRSRRFCIWWGRTWRWVMIRRGRCWRRCCSRSTTSTMWTRMRMRSMMTERVRVRVRMRMRMRMRSMRMRRIMRMSMRMRMSAVMWRSRMRMMMRAGLSARVILWRGVRRGARDAASSKALGPTRSTSLRTSCIPTCGALRSLRTPSAGWARMWTWMRVSRLHGRTRRTRRIPRRIPRRRRAGRGLPGCGDSRSCGRSPRVRRRCARSG